MNEEIALNTQKIKGKMKEKNITQNEMAKELCITPYSFSLKINKTRDFKVSEVEKMFNKLEITKEEVQYFF